jgi:2-oxoglutarate ferredoxin oxidoreductase subunit delta
VTRSTVSKRTESKRQARKGRPHRERPTFDLVRCKRCGICSAFCPEGAIGIREDGTPYLARPEVCRSCRLCEDMCPDWAVCLQPGEAGEGS